MCSPPTEPQPWQTPSDSSAGLCFLRPSFHSRDDPGSALPIWVFGPCILIVFEGSRDPCRVLATKAEPPSPGTSLWAFVSPSLLEMPPSVAAAAPCPPPNSGLAARGLGHTAVHVSQALRRRGLVWNPSPATCQGRGGEGRDCRGSSQLLSGLMGAAQGEQTGK